MRDRRNTNLSTSSTSSIDAFTPTSPDTHVTNKAIPNDIELLEACIKENRSSTYIARHHVVYRLSSLLCILLFVAFHIYPSAPCLRQLRKATVLRNGEILQTPVISTQTERLDLIDSSGRRWWTVSSPATAEFPFASTDYDTICRSQQQHAGSHHSWLPPLLINLFTQASSHSTYLEAVDAQAAGILPTPDSSSSNICSSSLTFSIDAQEASFGKTLLMLWLSYGIAKSEGRAFFVDDSRWVYGSLSTYFATIPDPGCDAPAPAQIVPCPFDARHILVSTSTARWSLQPRFSAITSSWTRQFRVDRKIFDHIRAGYEALFSVAEDDKAYAVERIDHLRSEATSRAQPLVGMHIRRGDMHPFELQFSQDYLPLERYTDAAKSLLHKSRANSTETVLLASDDPDLINTQDLSLAASPMHLLKTQERIQMATKAALDRDSPSQPIRQPGSAYVKHVDENIGWDGGFYTPLFFSLGASDTPLKRTHSLQALAQERPSKETLRMRELVGRAYLLDLEVLSHTDGVVCAVSSAACRVLGVMLGWDAVQQQRWINVDDAKPWSWDGGR